MPTFAARKEIRAVICPEFNSKMYLSKLNSSRKLHRIFLGGVVMSSNNPIDTSILPAIPTGGARTSIINVKPKILSHGSIIQNKELRVSQNPRNTFYY